MRFLLLAAISSAVYASPAHAASDLERGLDGALRGCEEWLLNPASWVEGTGPFVETVGLGQQMGLVDRVEEVNLPPKELRRANHYWRINSTLNAGYVLVVSDQLPMCHITGGAVWTSNRQSRPSSLRWISIGGGSQRSRIRRTA